MTTMNDICLRFADADEAQQVLEASGLTAEGTLAPGAWLDVIGVIATPLETLPGWHINALIDGNVPDQLQPYIVTPTRRVRVWA